MNISPDTNTEASLLPYLNGGNKDLALSLSMVSSNPSFPDKSSPFCILDDSDPMARLVEASFVTDAGSEIRKVFLLVSKDRYGLKGDQLWPLTNPDIDIAWQKAFSLYDGRKDDGSWIVLSSQINGSGRLNLLSSLFRCRIRNLYFHPPCPACGLPLRLCRDDELLSTSGLQPYSGSLKRYLYCASCSTKGVPEFFVHELDHNDPVTLRDMRSLINGFGSLKESRDPIGEFPCIGCPEHDTCYGSGHAAHSRIAPFSFYPCYLLMFQAMTLHSLDFLSLVSGASFEELKSSLSARSEMGRSNCIIDMQRDGLTGTSLLPDVDERSFLEVLYLKLSFLGDIIRQFIAGLDNTGHPVMMPTIDGIWVKLSPRSGLLPSFWNFKTKALDIIRPPDMAQLFPQSVTSSLLFQLGLLWFHALLVNRKQNSREVFLTICGGTPNGKGKSSDILSEEALHKIFPPEQIYWNPTNRKTNKNWFHMWEKSLDLGVRILRSAIDGDLKWPCLNLPDELEKIRTEVRIAMFAALPVKSEQFTQAERAAESDAIHEILMRILEKWRKRAETEAGNEAHADHIDRMETVILSPAKKMEPPPSSIEEDELTETVIISSGTSLNELNGRHRDPPHVRAGEKDLETVIISPEIREAGPAEAEADAKVEKAGPAGETEKKSAEGDALVETVIIASGKSRVKWNVSQ